MAYIWVTGAAEGLKLFGAKCAVKGESQNDEYGFYKKAAHTAGHKGAVPHT